jgi:DGQHR domain-containing protein
MSKVSVPALRDVQNGTELYLFFVPAQVFESLNIKVEQFDPNKSYEDEEQGYQRNAEIARMRKFARYLSQPDAISPTAILLNDRLGATSFDRGSLTFDPVHPVFNVDGQHREGGYEIRLKNDPTFGNFPIPVVMTKRMPKLREMIQFNVVNDTQKGVATSLVKAILSQVHADQGDKVIEEAGKGRDVVLYKTVEALNSQPNSPWHGFITLANQKAWTKKEKAEDQSRTKTRLVRAESFVDSLKPVHDYMTMFFDQMNIDKRVAKLSNTVRDFWEAIQEQMPEPWEEPQHYTLFQAGGVGPLHLVLKGLLAPMHVAHRSWDKENFKAMIQEASLLTDHDFWRSTDGDGNIIEDGRTRARIYSGKANWPDLAKMVKESIDENAPAVK